MRFTGQDFRDQVRDMGIEEVLSTPRSPWQGAYVERIIGSIRRECLDHVIVFDERSLRRTLACYFLLLSSIQNAPVAEQRLARATPDRTARDRAGRGDISGGWLAPSLRATRRLK